MVEATAMKPETRVRLIVGGNFSLDALGRAHDEILAAVRADPAGHLHAFEQLYLSSATNRRALTELYLPNFLSIVAPLLPDQVRRAAQLLADRMGAVAREQEAEFYENADETAAVELTRQRQQLDDRRYDLAQILSGR